MLIHRFFSAASLRYSTALVVLGVSSAASVLLAGALDTYVQPLYMGRPLSYWVDVLGRPSLSYKSSSFVPEVTEIEGGIEAQQALEHIGTNAIPFLVRWIEEAPRSAKDDSKEATLELFPTTTWQERADLGRYSNRAEGAMQAFGVLGPLATSAIPELARLVTNRLGAGAQSITADRGTCQPPCAWFVLHALGTIGPKSLPVLLNVATDKTRTSATRMTALAAIGLATGTNIQAALPAMLECAEDSDDWVAAAAVGSLGVHGQHDQRVFSALTNALHYPAQSVRFRAVEALEPFGGQALLALLSAFSDTNYGVRDLALTTLIRAAPQALTNAAVLASAAESLRSPDSGARLFAAQLLWAASRQARGERPSLKLPDYGLDALCFEATNTLRQLAPKLLDKAPPADGPRR